MHRAFTAVAIVVLFAGYSLVSADTLNTSPNAFSAVVGNDSLIATQHMPIWLHANRRGYISDEEASTLLWSELSYERSLTSDISFAARSGLGIGSEDGDHFFGQLRQESLTFGWRFLELKGGVFPFTRGTIPFPEPGSGSLSVSDNAYPIPSIQLTTPDFVPIPCTNDQLSLLAGTSHGWFTGDGTVEGRLLHEEWTYPRAGRQSASVSIVDESDVRLPQWHTMMEFQYHRR